MEDISKFVKPRNITLDKYEYSYKDLLTNEYYSYRCKHRNACKITIKISKTELIKIIENKENEIIKYTITSTGKHHQCEKDKQETSAIIQKEYKIKAGFLKSIIIEIIEKPFLFHYNNIKKNNIIITFKQYI